jgi:hypothetical protein
MAHPIWTIARLLLWLYTWLHSCCLGVQLPMEAIDAWIDTAWSRFSYVVRR